MAGMEYTDNQITAPAWAVDNLTGDNLLAAPIKLDPAQFMAEDGTKVVLSANASADAVSISFAALTNPIPSGTVLDFGGKKFARTTALAVKGATTVAVSAIPTALSSGDIATYTGVKKKRVKGSVFVGRTYTERNSNTAFGPAASGDEECYIVAFDNPDLDKDPTVTVLRNQRVIKENRIAEWATISADSAVLALLRSKYQTIKGA